MHLWEQQERAKRESASWCAWHDEQLKEREAMPVRLVDVEAEQMRCRLCGALIVPYRRYRRLCNGCRLDLLE